MNELTELKVEEMRLQLENWRADEEEAAFQQARDMRRFEVQQEMLIFLQQFLKGDITVDEFRATFDRRTRKEWDVFGLKGMSGAMFLNTLVKHINDQAELAQRLRILLLVPESDKSARQKMADFYNYLMAFIDNGEISKRQIQPVRLTFFASGWWHLQDVERWPIFYISGRNKLGEAKLYERNEDPIIDYFAFRTTFQKLEAKLGITSWELEHFLSWDGENAVNGDGDGKKVIEKDLSHSHIQWLLATIGRKMGCKVWIATNDHKRTWKGKTLGDLSIAKLPTLGLDADSQRMIGLIDVIWLEGFNKVAAAFEVEHTTSVYSGLLRMSDLLAVSPNLNFPLYIVAPKSRTEKVRRELSRPTFQSLGLHEQCGYFSFEALVAEAEAMMRWGNSPQVIAKLAKKVDERSGKWV